jgi:hypothetical protein
MTDLNTLIAAGSPWFLLEALGINDRGQVAGYTFHTSTGEVHGFVATPCEGTGQTQIARIAPTPQPPHQARRGKDPRKSSSLKKFARCVSNDGAFGISSPAPEAGNRNRLSRSNPKSRDASHDSDDFVNRTFIEPKVSSAAA